MAKSVFISNGCLYLDGEYAGGCSLWSGHERLRRAAEHLGVAWPDAGTAESRAERAEGDFRLAMAREARDVMWREADSLRADLAAYRRVVDALCGKLDLPTNADWLRHVARQPGVVGVYALQATANALDALTAHLAGREPQKPAEPEPRVTAWKVVRVLPDGRLVSAFCGGHKQRQYSPETAVPLCVAYETKEQAIAFADAHRPAGLEVYRARCASTFPAPVGTLPITKMFQAGCISCRDLVIEERVWPEPACETCGQALPKEEKP